MPSDECQRALAQRDNLFPHLTVAENVKFALFHRGSDAGNDITTILFSVGLSDRAQAYPATLSGGEIARAGLAVALALDAPLIVADEPTAEVDAKTEKKILDLLVDRSRRGKGALIATHSSAVEAIATHRLHLSDGRLVDRSLIMPVASDDGVVSDLCGVAASALLHNDRQPLIEAHDLARNYDLGGRSIHAVEQAAITIRQGDRIAVTGPSGSGKSTLLKMLAGIVRPTTGVVDWFGGKSAKHLRPRRIGVVFQEPSLISTLTVRQNVDLPLQFAAASHERPLMSADEALALLSLSDLAEKLPDELSGGQMQRVAFARALVTNPQVILADEPTGQLDQPTGHAVMGAVLEALDQNETALLVTTHDMRLASIMATQFHMDHGRLAAAV